MYHKGFTLVELMVAVSVTMILLVVGVPSFNATILRMESRSLTDQFTSAVNFSRNEAITRNTRVSLCASSDGLVCDPAITSEWNNGWIATFQDTNNQTQLIKSWRITNGNGLVALTSATVPDRISFTAEGDVFLQSLAAAGANITMSVQSSSCDSSKSERRNVQLTPFGTMTINKVVCDD